jgi:hypothetical protein
MKWRYVVVVIDDLFRDSEQSSQRQKQSSLTAYCRLVDRGQKGR